MNDSSNNIWAKLIALNPDKEDIRLFSQPEGFDESYKSSAGWTISQKSTGDTWITNISEPLIRIDDDWLETNKEKEIFSGQRISFDKDKESRDEDFDYVFHIMNSKVRNSNKRSREGSQEPSAFSSNPETTKLAKVISGVEQELTCSICMKIFHHCVALNPCLHTFCSWCVLSSFRSSVNCPLCRIEATSITKNFALQNLVDLTLKNFPDKERPKEEIEQKNTELEGRIVKGSNWTYIGTSQNGKREGKGSIIYSKGNIYEGIWKNDKREGRGSLTFPKGYICKGLWLNDEVQNIDEIIYANRGVYKGETKGFDAHGKGVLKYYKGDIYDGNFVADRIEGFGKYIYTSGAEYEGEWKRNFRDGTGAMKFADGGIYKGEWKDDKREGERVLTFEDGDRYDGSWMNNCFHGKGKYTWNDDEEYEGEWIDGIQNGSGTMKYKNGRIYEGEWKNDGREGDGTLTFANGDKYQGVWKENVLESVRKIYYANGDVYEGEIQIEYVTREGKGVLTYKNGDKYDGFWENDKKHGNRREICRDGELIYEGVWIEGKASEVIMTDADGIKYKVEWKKLDEDEQIDKKEDSLKENKDTNGEENKKNKE